MVPLPTDRREEGRTYTLLRNVVRKSSEAALLAAGLLTRASRCPPSSLCWRPGFPIASLSLPAPLPSKGSGALIASRQFFVRAW
jgi:hypothetical protein